MQILLRVPDLIEVIKPFVGYEITIEDIFRFIGNGDIRPFGLVQRMPIFSLEQVAGIVNVLRELGGNNLMSTIEETKLQKAIEILKKHAHQKP